MMEWKNRPFMNICWLVSQKKWGLDGSPDMKELKNVQIKKNSEWQKETKIILIKFLKMKN